MSTTQTVLDLDELCINTMRTLAMDAIQQANSGHPGTPTGMSPTVYCLWQRLLRFDPEDPIWMNRDRFVLSAGHASTLTWDRRASHIRCFRATKSASEGIWIYYQPCR